MHARTNSLVPSLLKSKPLGTGRQRSVPAQSKLLQQGRRQVPAAQSPDWQWGDGASPWVQAAPSALVPGFPWRQAVVTTGLVDWPSVWAQR